MNGTSDNRGAWAPGSGLPGEGIVVTGAASGIGRATALRAAEAGMNVVLVDRNEKGLEDAAGLLKARAGIEVRTIVADLTELRQVDAVVAAARGMGSVRRMFHAAGVIVRRAEPAEVTEEDWNLQIDVNQKASWFLTRAFCEDLVARDLSGAVALVSSISGSLGVMSGSWVYGATKGAVHSMVRGFAKSYAGVGIRVNALSPGIVETPMVRGEGQNVAVSSLIEAHVPMARCGRPEEVADAGLFLLSDYASYINGVNLDVDGGWLRR